MDNKITIGARGSKLSLAYANKVRSNILSQVPGIDKEIIIKTIKRTLMKKVKYNYIYPNIRSSNRFIKIVENLNLRNSLKKTFVDLK